VLAGVGAGPRGARERGAARGRAAARKSLRGPGRGCRVVYCTIRVNEVDSVAVPEVAPTVNV